MPRIRQNAAQYAADDFRKALKNALVNCGKKQKDLAAETGIPESTVSERIRDPRKLTLGQMQEIVRATQMEPEAVLKFLGYKVS
jgi:predicted transcriptional regulator